MFPAPPALTSLTESLQTAGATVEALDRQNDSLQHSKDLIHNEGKTHDTLFHFNNSQLTFFNGARPSRPSAYLLTKSDRILRGMGSWSGWAYNTFVKSESTELRNSSTRNVTSVEVREVWGDSEDEILFINVLTRRLSLLLLPYK